MSRTCCSAIPFGSVLLELRIVFWSVVPRGLCFERANQPFRAPYAPNIVHRGTRSILDLDGICIC